ncbi:MAG: hypothetical protein AAB417_04210 [Patescibacteria group bacterium]
MSEGQLNNDAREGAYASISHEAHELGFEETIRQRTEALSGGAAIGAEDLEIVRRVAHFMYGLFTPYARQNTSISSYYKMYAAAFDIHDRLPAGAIDGGKEVAANLVERARGAGMIIPNAKGVLIWQGRHYGPASGDEFIMGVFSGLVEVTKLYPDQIKVSPEQRALPAKKSKLPSLQDEGPFHAFIDGKSGTYWLDWRHEGRRYMAELTVTDKGVTARVGGDLRGEGFDIANPTPLGKMGGWLFNVLCSLARVKHGGVPKQLR